MTSCYVKDISRMEPAEIEAWVESLCPPGVRPAALTYTGGLLILVTWSA